MALLMGVILMVVSLVCSTGVHEDFFASITHYNPYNFIHLNIV